MINEKQTKLISLKKASSHIQKVIKMVENDEYCVNIMQQNLAIIGLLKSLHLKLMESHLKSCFLSAMTSGNEKKKTEMVEEILTVTKLTK